MNKVVVATAIIVLLVGYISIAHAEYSKPQKYLNGDEKSKIKKTKNYKSTHVALEKTKIQKIDKSGFRKAPNLTGITGYINTSPDELKAAMRGKVVLYDFWTYSCYNCQNTFPYVKSWHEKYADKGLVIVGIHHPEFQFERDIENVRQAVTSNEIKFPVVLDNDGVNWDAFGNNYWPRFYLADAEGYIRYDHIGEGAYDQTEKTIKLLLQEINS